MLNGELETHFSVKGLRSDICNITIRDIKTVALCTNVRGAGDYVVSLAGAVKNLVIYGIEAVGNTRMLLDKRTK